MEPIDEALVEAEVVATTAPRRRRRGLLVVGVSVVVAASAAVLLAGGSDSERSSFSAGTFTSDTTETTVTKTTEIADEVLAPVDSTIAAETSVRPTIAPTPGDGDACANAEVVPNMVGLAFMAGADRYREFVDAYTACVGAAPFPTPATLAPTCTLDESLSQVIKGQVPSAGTRLASPSSDRFVVQYWVVCPSGTMNPPTTTTIAPETTTVTFPPATTLP